MRGGRTAIVAVQTEDGAERAFLLVVGRDSYATYNLPATGSLTIGSARAPCPASPGADAPRP